MSKKKKKKKTSILVKFGVFLVCFGLWSSFFSLSCYLNSPDECDEDENGDILDPEACIAKRAGLQSVARAFEQFALACIIAGIGFILFGRK